MTIEIRELVIQAQVTQGAAAAEPARALKPLGRAEQDRLVEKIIKQVMEQLRDERERML